MKRVGVLIVILALLTFSTVNPSMSSIPAAIVDEAQEAPFLTAADGDVSSESIGEDYGHKFRETSDDDVLTYPDSFNKTFVATSGDYHENLGSGSSWTLSQEDDSLWFNANDMTDGGPWISLTWATPDYRACDAAIISILDIYAWEHTGTPPFTCLTYNIYVYDHTAAAYELLSGPHTQSAWDSHDDHSLYTADPDHFGGDFKIMLNTSGVAANKPVIGLDYTGIEFCYMTQVDADHYGDSFFDISDWSTSGNEAEDLYSTDGDVGKFEANWAGGTDYDQWYAVASMSGSYYFEMRYRTNQSNPLFYIRAHEGATPAGAHVWDWTVVQTGGAWETIKIPKSGTMGNIIIRSRLTSYNSMIEIEYIRLGDETEMGWQHDCSTTEAMRTMDDGVTPTITSDGDKIHVVGTSGSYSGLIVEIDDTTTESNLKTSYYPFFEINMNASTSQDIRFKFWDENSAVTYYNDYVETNAFTTARINIDALVAGSYINQIQIYDHNDGAQDFYVDWMDCYSIANFTVTQSASVTVSEYLYVDNGVLKCEKSSANYLKIVYDPTMSVDRAVYPVWNLTMANYELTDGVDFKFWEQLNYPHQDETRGTWTLTGTMTAFSITFCSDNDFYLSAIKFWEDTTAPDILDKFITPNEPDDDEPTTITAVTSDGVSVYDLTINAVVSPDGFSDVDYDMTEQQTDLWTYEFATLSDGYYLFEIRANDGANTYSEYLPVTVRESSIVVQEITLIGAGSDFTMMQFSARINKDCSYVIYEESENNAESATHSGSVSEPSFNLAWTKLSTTDTNVNFTIRFTNGTLTYNYTSQYQVAQTALAITGDESLSQDEIVFSGTSTKACSWTLYLDSVQEDTGTISAAGSFVVNWTRTQSITPASISFAIKFYTATETVWKNGTYSEYSLTAFSIQTLYLDLTDPTVSVIFTTSWGNATGYLYENDVQQDTAAEGITLSYSKATAAGTYNVALKMDAGGEIAWYNTTYSVSAENALSITALSFDSSGPNVSLFVNTNWANCTLTVYENEVQKASGSEGTLSYLKATIAGDYNVSVKVDGTADILWANYTYTVAAESALNINALILDKSGPNITAFVTTNWANCTITIYQDDVQKDSDSESITLSYARSTAAGTYAIAIKIDGGASTLWHNDSYTVAVTTLQVTDDSIRTTASYAYLSGHVNLNANYTVYEETVKVGTGSVSAGSFEIHWTKASSSVENVTVLFESDSQTYPVYSGYDVAEQATFVVESWWMDLNLGVESYVEFYVLSSYENATVYVYDNNTLMTTVTESAGGAYSYFWLSESEGLHTITLNITHGATVHTRTRTYYIPNWAATGLVIRWDLWTFQDNYTMLELGSNWMNCTYYVYLNSSLVATSANDPVTLNFTRAINIGTYNLTIFADAGTQTYTIKNIRYVITAEGVTYDFSTVSGGRSVREGDIIEGDTYEGDDVVINENPPGIYMTAETAATIAVSTVFIFFLAVLFTNSRVKKAQLDIDKKGNQ